MRDLARERHEAHWPLRHFLDCAIRCEVCHAAITASAIGWQFVIPWRRALIVTCNAHYCRDRGAKGLVS